MYMQMGGFRIPYIQGDIEYGVPILIILGSIFTSWAYSLLSLAIVWVLHWRIDPILYIPLANTIIILTVSTSLALFYGIKNKNAKLIRSWYLAKIFECICTIVQVLLFLCTFNSFWPMAFFGIFMLPCGLYLIVCVRKINDDVTNQSATDQACEIITEKPVIQKI